MESFFIPSKVKCMLNVIHPSKENASVGFLVGGMVGCNVGDVVGASVGLEAG